MPPKALHDNMSPTRRWLRPLRLHWAVVLMHLPSPQVKTGRRNQHRWCPPRLLHSFFVIVVVILGLDLLCCGHRHLSRCAAASLVAPPPLSPRQCLSHCTSLTPANRIRSCQRCWITPEDGCFVGEKKDGKILSHLHKPSEPSLLPLDELWWEKSSGWYCQEWHW